MFHVGFIPYSEHEQFGDFWKCLSIFNKATKLQNNRKQEIEKKRYLTVQPTTVVAYWPKPARPTRGSTVFFLLPGGEAAACPAHSRAAPAPACHLTVSRHFQPCRIDALVPLCLLLSHNSPRPFARYFSRASPTAVVAAARCCPGHRNCLAFQPCPAAPPSSISSPRPSPKRLNTLHRPPRPCLPPSAADIAGNTTTPPGPPRAH